MTAGPIGSEINITRRHARRFLLIHHFLWPPRSLRGVDGIWSVFQRLGSIQFDPINVTGRNPDLVLQSRVSDHRAELLDQMLYGDRDLIDGWDKMACIYPSRDWPEFARQRTRMSSYYQSRWPEAMSIADKVVAELERSGPLASNEFENHDTVEGAWGQSARVVRICLNGLFESGRLGIASRKGTRRSFDLLERLHPESAAGRAPTHSSDGEYLRWHVMRRVASLGLARDRAGVHWSGIVGAGQSEIRETLTALLASGGISRLRIEDRADQDFYIRTEDVAALEQARRSRLRVPRAVFLAPLDNLLWDRDMVAQIFGFDYVWEVYKPADQRRYGYYVLPILVGDELVGRIEPRVSSDGSTLDLLGWWWEPGYHPNDAARRAVRVALGQFMKFLKVKDVVLRTEPPDGIDPTWLEAIGPSS